MRVIRNYMPWLAPLLGVAILVVVAGSGCRGGSAQPTPTPTVAGLSGAGALTTSTVRPSPGTTPGTTVTATTIPMPPRSIESGYWDMHFVVVSNSCGGDPTPGTAFEFEYLLDEIREPADGYLTDGEPVKVTHIGGKYVANLVFTWPQFQFEYPLPSSDGRAYVTLSFDSPTHGTAALTEAYETGGGDTCSIFLRDDG
ncbi:MAG: hypothetical protein LC118_05695 [Dehalococcoidia bacterium]|nr:hypothetical protein [Dehalococcoidia bacterium]